MISKGELVDYTDHLSSYVPSEKDSDEEVTIEDTSSNKETGDSKSTQNEHPSSSSSSSISSCGEDETIPINHDIQCHGERKASYSGQLTCDKTSRHASNKKQEMQEGMDFKIRATIRKKVQGLDKSRSSMLIRQRVFDEAIAQTNELNEWEYTEDE